MWAVAAELGRNSLRARCESIIVPSPNVSADIDEHRRHAKSRRGRCTTFHPRMLESRRERCATRPSGKPRTHAPGRWTCQKKRLFRGVDRHISDGAHSKTQAGFPFFHPGVRRRQPVFRRRPLPGSAARISPRFSAAFEIAEKPEMFFFFVVEPELSSNRRSICEGSMNPLEPVGTVARAADQARALRARLGCAPDSPLWAARVARRQ